MNRACYIILHHSPFSCTSLHKQRSDKSLLHKFICKTKTGAMNRACYTTLNFSLLTFNSSLPMHFRQLHFQPIELVAQMDLTA
jgi:hypothetical protein